MDPAAESRDLPMLLEPLELSRTRPTTAACAHVDNRLALYSVGREVPLVPQVELIVLVVRVDVSGVVGGFEPEMLVVVRSAHGFCGISSLAFYLSSGLPARLDA